MIETLRDIYGRISVHAHEDEEHEAVVDLLVLMMFADGRVRLGETDEIETIASDMGWENERFSVGQYLGVSVAKVRNAHEEGTIDALLADIDDRIVNTVLRSLVTSVARDVADADADRAPEEDALLGLIAKLFP